MDLKAVRIIQVTSHGILVWAWASSCGREAKSLGFRHSTSFSWGRRKQYSTPDAVDGEDRMSSSWLASLAPQPGSRSQREPEGHVIHPSHFAWFSSPFGVSTFCVVFLVDVFGRPGRAVWDCGVATFPCCPKHFPLGRP